MPVLTAEERIGTRIAGKYRLDRILGRGGFGVVFAGLHEWTDRSIAVKLLSHDFSHQEVFVKRFLQEARAASKLKHANVVDVLDMGQDADGSVYLVLELLEGRDLGKHLEERGPISFEQAMQILAPIMDALADAHDRGIVHRDLKPDNIFLSVDAKGRTVPKLLDFGIAKVTDGTGNHTATGMVIGTPHYMSPEQARARGDLGPPADVWSMGVVLWRCLSGALPFDADTPTGVIADILTRRAAPFTHVLSNVPPDVARAIDRALEPEVAHRYPHMRAFLEALEAARKTSAVIASANTVQFHEPKPAPDTAETPMHWASQVPSAPEAKKSSGRAPLFAAVAALAIVGIVTAGSIIVLGGSSAPRRQAGRPAASAAPIVQAPPRQEPAAPAPVVVAPEPAAPPVPQVAAPEPVAAVVEPAVQVAAPEPAPIAQPARSRRAAPQIRPQQLAPAPQPMVQPAPIAQPPARPVQRSSVYIPD